MTITYYNEKKDLYSADIIGPIEELYVILKADEECFLTNGTAETNEIKVKFKNKDEWYEVNGALATEEDFKNALIQLGVEF